MMRRLKILGEGHEQMNRKRTDRVELTKKLATARVVHFRRKRRLKIVTATAHNEVFDAKFRSRSDVAPKHVKGERPVRNWTAKGKRAPPAKNEHKRRLQRRLFHLQNTVLCPSVGD